MSGTSMDGVDGVIVPISPSSIHITAHAHTPFSASLRDQLLHLQKGTHNELHQAQQAAFAVTELYAQTVSVLLQKSGLQHHQISAIGAHGQTIRHCPPCIDRAPCDTYSIQLLQAARLAEYTSISVITDFRSRDIAAQGQGAPLVPAFHHALMAKALPCSLVNIGGMSNITCLEAHQGIKGRDTGPGNVLMDAWMQKNTPYAMDDQGKIAASGQVHHALLELLLQHPFFQKAQNAPLSTGREDFHLEWVQHCVDSLSTGEPLSLADIMATLCELTAISISRALPAHHPVWVAGGGAFNLRLMQRLRALCALKSIDSVESIHHFGFDPMHIEAAAFAWLASQFCQGKTSNIPEVTGATGHRILGAFYPA